MQLFARRGVSASLWQRWVLGGASLWQRCEGLRPAPRVLSGRDLLLTLSRQIHTELQPKAVVIIIVVIVVIAVIVGIIVSVVIIVIVDIDT